MMTIQIYTNRQDGNGWVLDGCWGSDDCAVETEKEARELCAHLAEQYPDTDWGYCTGLGVHIVYEASDRVINYLEDHGAMSGLDICRDLGVDETYVDLLEQDGKIQRAAVPHGGVSPWFEVRS